MSRSSSALATRPSSEEDATRQVPAADPREGSWFWAPFRVHVQAARFTEGGVGLLAIDDPSLGGSAWEVCSVVSVVRSGRRQFEVRYAGVDEPEYFAPLAEVWAIETRQCTGACKRWLRLSRFPTTGPESRASECRVCRNERLGRTP